MVFSYELKTFPPRAKDHLPNIPTQSMRSPLLHNCLALSKRPPNTLQAIVIALGFPTEVNGKSLLQKTSWTSDTQPKAPWAGTDLRKPPPRWLAFTDQEVLCKLPKAGSNTWVPPNPDPPLHTNSPRIQRKWGARSPAAVTTASMDDHRDWFRGLLVYWNGRASLYSSSQGEDGGQGMNCCSRSRSSPRIWVRLSVT